MGEIVNLRRARKAKARDEARDAAAANRFRFGRKAVEKRKAEAETESARRRLDGQKLDEPG
ncbi:MAG: DUF4169 family protein [Alphaproteobacteria bacterium]|nr:DUF4169 family protein [Alphaproteobacteria bacterium]